MDLMLGALAGMDATLAVAGLVAVVAFGAVTLGMRRLIRLFPGAAVAEFDALENQEWELVHSSAAARSYRLCAKIRYHGGCSGGMGNASFTGLECDLHVTVGDQVLVDETVSFHGKTSERVSRVITMAYMSSEVRDGDYMTRKGTYVLATIPRCRPGTKVVARGTFRPMPGTDTSMLDVFLGR